MRPATLSLDTLREVIARLPTTRQEDWKYTDLSPIVDIGNQWLDRGAKFAAAADVSAAGKKIQQRIDADWLVVANGLINDQSLVAMNQAGVRITRLSDSNDKSECNTALADLNAALLHDGLRISVDANTEIEKPIGILIIDDSDSPASMSATRIEIELAAGSQASFIEYHTSSGTADHYANSVVNLQLGDNSRVNYVRIQDRSRQHSQTGHLAVSLGRDSSFDHCAFDLGGRLVRNDVRIDIANPGSSASFNGIYLAGNQQHIDNHTRVDHRVGPAKSRQEYRGILAGNARCIWNGKAVVHAGADGTDAEQANHNLLLSEKAEVDAKPELEIYADDVKCSHGTTIGQLDETALFYLRTRGLSKRDAKQVLTRAFAQAIVSKSPIASIREVLAEMISTRLAGLVEGAAE
jgi:Fe-S cluster assembly protein SufD